MKERIAARKPSGVVPYPGWNHSRAGNRTSGIPSGMGRIVVGQGWRRTSLVVGQGRWRTSRSVMGVLPAARASRLPVEGSDRHLSACQPRGYVDDFGEGGVGADHMGVLVEPVPVG